MRDAQGAQSVRKESRQFGESGKAKGKAFFQLPAPAAFALRASGPVFGNRPAFRPQNASEEGNLSTNFSCFNSALRSVDGRCGPSAFLTSKILFLNANESADTKKASPQAGLLTSWRSPIKPFSACAVRAPQRQQAGRRSAAGPGAKAWARKPRSRRCRAMSADTSGCRRCFSRRRRCSS